MILRAGYSLGCFVRLESGGARNDEGGNIGLRVCFVGRAV